MRYKASLLLFIALSVISVSAQTADDYIRELKSKLFDVGNAQFKLSVAKNGRSVDFVNESSEGITEFQMGCVKRKNSILEILSERTPEKSSLASASATTREVEMWSSEHGFFSLEECKKGKLAIIGVHLENGNRWELK